MVEWLRHLFGTYMSVMEHNFLQNSQVLQWRSA